MEDKQPSPNEKKQEELGYIKPREITDEIQESYLAYAMSVIVSRALPDVRDGLKPVHRRILYTMYDDGLRHNVKFRKSANVVGMALARYHPHGDLAVYDSLARMAQNFSLRYVLVDGQGNWGCFTKDTKIKLTDGRDIDFENLIAEHKADKKNYTYTINQSGLISIAEIKNPRLTRKSAQLVKVVLDNGQEIRCTPNHLFLLKSGLYKEAQALVQGDSLMPLYQKISEKTDRLQRDGYTLIYQNKKNEWVPSHHLADNYNLTHNRYKKNRGRVRHHLDFNKLNNNPNNITRIRWQEHWQIHYENASHQHKDPKYRAKIAEGRRRYWANPKNKAVQSKNLSLRNIKNWQNPSSGKLKFLKVCQTLLENQLILNKGNYDRFRNQVYSYGSATSWQVGLDKYFQGNSELIYQEINKNHKVVRVQELDYVEDVFDLTIDNSHNFCLAAGVFVHNSVDGDGPAAQRYTECRLSRIGEDMLSDIDKETVDFTPNYDATRKEPIVLPSPAPHLLLNGSLGIAVGMATNIPPHNLTEVIQACCYLIDNPDSTTEDLLQFVKGPDFPTGGIIYGKKDIQQAYSQGKGPIVIRGKAEIDENKKGLPQIIITEIPYQVQKSSLVQQFAKLVEEKKIENIKDIRDESDRQGMRIVLELKKEAFPKKILNGLFKYSDLQKTFHLNMLALVEGIQPKVLSLVDVLTYYLKHKQEVVVRRLQFDLAKAKQRAHILDGLMIALKNIDEVIKIIKKSDSKDQAKENLMKKFKLSEAQAIAILEMRLQNLAKLEQAKIEEELALLEKTIKEIETILKSEKKIKETMKQELQAFEAKHRDERKTKVVAGRIGEIGEEDLIPNENAIILLTSGGYIKRMKVSFYKTQKRGGAGVAGADVSQEDAVEHLLLANNLDKLLFFTNTGKAFQCLTWEIPELKRISKGRGILNFLETSQNEKILSLLSYNKEEEEAGKKYLFFATKNGIIKRTELSGLKNVRKNGILAIKMQEGDSLREVLLAEEKDEIFLATKLGQSIRFAMSDVRPMGRASSGVRGIRLDKNDEVVGLSVIPHQSQKQQYLLIVMQNGYGKRSKVEEYRLQKRGGSGIKAAKVNEKTGKIVFAKVVSENEKEIILISAKGQVIRSDFKSISIIGRASSGVRIMRLKPGDKVVSGICLREIKELEVGQEVGQKDEVGQKEEEKMS